MRYWAGLIIVALVVSLLGSVTSVDAYKNTTCIDSNTQQVNTSVETLLNDEWINETSIVYNDCPLGCSTIDGGICKMVVSGVIPIELFIPIQAVAFFFLIFSWPFRTAFSGDKEFGYSEVIFPLFSGSMFFISGYLSLFLFPISTGEVFMGTFLFYLNTSMGILMLLFSAVYTFNIMDDKQLRRRGLR